MKTLLVIAPGKKFEHGRMGAVFNILNAETGEHLASHFCSNWTFAWGDLYENRPERIEEWKKRFGEFEVKYIDETEISDPVRRVF
jgi:hypothetical protein